MAQQQAASKTPWKPANWHTTMPANGPKESAKRENQEVLWLASVRW